MLVSVPAAKVIPMLTRPRARRRVGTVLNVPTTQEVKDLIKAKDADIAAMGQGYADLSPTWVDKDNAAFLAWTSDWNDMLSRYESAQASIKTELDSASASAPAGTEWDAVMTALRQAYPGYARGSDAPVPNTKGDLQDLQARLAAAGGKVPAHDVPQPTKGADTDLNVYKGADKAIGFLESLPTPVLLVLAYIAYQHFKGRR